MAISYSILASGSSGNCVWVRGGGVEILVDCGLSAKAIGLCLAEAGGTLDEVSAVVCTHGHIDHVAGAAVLARRHDLDIHATAATLWSIPNHPPRERLRPMPVEGGIRIGGLAIRTVPTLHDSRDSVGLVLSDGDTHLGIVTDLGRPTQRLIRALANVDGLILEANHDLDMLLEGPYPARLKRRITSRFGHLSNDQSADLVDQLFHTGLQQLTLAHLSEQNNTPELAESAIEAVLEQHSAATRLAVASQHAPTELVTLEANAELSLHRNPPARAPLVCTPQVASPASEGRQLRLSYWKP